MNFLYFITIYLLCAIFAIFHESYWFFRGNEQIVLNKGSDGEFIVQTYVGGNKLLEIIMVIIWIFVIVYAFIQGIIKAFVIYIKK